MEITAVDHVELSARLEAYAQSRVNADEAFAVGVGARLGVYMAYTDFLLRELCRVAPETAADYVDRVTAR